MFQSGKDFVPGKRAPPDSGFSMDLLAVFFLMDTVAQITIGDPLFIQLDLLLTQLRGSTSAQGHTWLLGLKPATFGT